MVVFRLLVGRIPRMFLHNGSYFLGLAIPSRVFGINCSLVNPPRRNNQLILLRQLKCFKLETKRNEVTQKIEYAMNPKQIKRMIL